MRITSRGKCFHFVEKGQCLSNRAREQGSRLDPDTASSPGLQTGACFSSLQAYLNVFVFFSFEISQNKKKSDLMSCCCDLACVWFGCNGNLPFMTDFNCLNPNLILSQSICTNFTHFYFSLRSTDALARFRAPNQTALLLQKNRSRISQLINICISDVHC